MTGDTVATVEATRDPLRRNRRDSSTLTGQECLPRVIVIYPWFYIQVWGPHLDLKVMMHQPMLKQAGWADAAALSYTPFGGQCAGTGKGRGPELKTTLS